MATEPRLTRLHKNLLCQAYGRPPDYQVMGGSPKSKETLVVLKYITRIGMNKNGYDVHVLTRAGIDLASSIIAEHQERIVNNTSKTAERITVKHKAALLDDIVTTLTNSEIIGTKTLDLPNGLRIKFNKNGSDDFIVKITKP